MAIDQKPVSSPPHKRYSQKMYMGLKPSSSWKPLVFVDLRVPCLEYSAAAEIDMLRMTDNDQLAIDDLITLLERFEGTPSAPDLGNHGAVSMEKLPVYRMQLELAHHELEKRNALLEKAQARLAEDEESRRQMREAFLKETDSLRNQLSIQKRKPSYVGDDIEYIPLDDRSKTHHEDSDSEIDFWRSQSNEMNTRMREMQKRLKKAEDAMAELLRMLRKFNGTDLASWLRNECGLTDERAAQLILALGGVLESETSEIADHPTEDKPAKTGNDVVQKEVVVEKVITSNNDEVTRLRRMLDNVVRFDRAGRLAKSPAQQKKKMWNQHEIDLGQLAKDPHIYLQAASDNSDFLNSATMHLMSDDNEFLQKIARPKCLSYPPPLLETPDVPLNWPNIDPKAWMRMREEMEDSPRSDSSEVLEQIPIRPSKPLQETFTPVGSLTTPRKSPRPEGAPAQGSASRIASSKSSKSRKASKESVMEEEKPLPDRTEVKRHAEIGILLDETVDKCSKKMPSRCPYCGRDLLEPLPFDYSPWRYYKPESGFKRPDDIDVAAIVRAALVRRGQVKVFDRLFYKRFNEPWQRKRAPQTAVAPVIVQNKCALQDKSVSAEPDQDGATQGPSTLMEATAASASTLSVIASTGAGNLASTVGAGSLASTATSLGPLKTLDLTFGDAGRAQNAEARRKVWELVEESEGVFHAGPSRSGRDRASSAGLKRIENNSGMELASTPTPAPTLDARWKPLAPLQQSSDRSLPSKHIQLGHQKQEDALRGAVRPVRSAGHCRQHPTPEEKRTEESRNMLEALWQQRRALDCAPEELDHSTSPRMALDSGYGSSNGGKTIRSVLAGRVQHDPSVLRPKKALARCGSAPNFRRRGSRV
eukprot:gnl/MRDRNA2_/MRDRNA2_31708_c0_seq1.p1 gnl/MRDRNA2_/MRDRNA2_31708_c0~~gnl/MRDRNA2_/MRDRNA2_31708_c0_seq1.p1  ORF type:complete len:874 (-),score=190.87 gnl/MRDRNA2_/MRDRNA2_31708_c0_seq1:48-2669(-)